MLNVLISIFVILLLATGVSLEPCYDIDPGACAILSQQNHALCDDPAFASSTCPRTCKKCRLTCYHCDFPVQRLHECNSTRTCQIGEQCMWLEATSTGDGHHGYRMNCATTTFCDGNAILAVGKRSLNARDVTIRCCTSDNCNNPALWTTTTMTTTTTLPPPTTTQLPPPVPNTMKTTIEPIATTASEKSTAILTTRMDMSTQPPVMCQRQWSDWTNTDTPNTGDGDREIWTKDQLDTFCPMGNISGIICQTTDGVASFDTGEIMSCTTAKGAVCLNNDNFPIPCTPDSIETDEAVNSQIETSESADVVSNQTGHESFIDPDSIETDEAVNSQIETSESAEVVSNQTGHESFIEKRGKNVPWSRSAEEFLRKAFKSYVVTRSAASVHNTDIIMAQNTCTELSERTLTQIRSKLNNMRLGQSK